MNRTHYEMNDRPFDACDKLVMQACWFAACALIIILVFTA